MKKVLLEIDNLDTFALALCSLDSQQKVKDFLEIHSPGSLLAEFRGWVAYSDLKEQREQPQAAVTITTWPPHQTKRDEKKKVRVLILSGEPEEARHNNGGQGGKDEAG